MCVCVGGLSCQRPVTQKMFPLDDVTTYIPGKFMRSSTTMPLTVRLEGFLSIKWKDFVTCVILIFRIDSKCKCIFLIQK